MSDKLLPAVDYKFLASCFELKSWPKEDEAINEYQAMAFRVITDAFRPDSISNKLSPNIIKHNATVWIKQAREMGFSAGIESERRSWKDKIRKMFGVE